MWTLTSKKTGEVYYLLPEKENHSVGRANADLVLSGDASISRSHACLYVAKDGVKVIDLGSKYGTYYNENIENKEPMAKNMPVELKNGERVKFGMLENEWILSKMNICTLTSTLISEHKSELCKLFDQLAGRIVDRWEKSCTHLTMAEITVTHKVLQALVENIPIVTMDFWRTYLENLRIGKPPPKATEFLPLVAESFINHENVSFRPVTGRRTVFAGKNFVFMSSLPYEKYKPIIESAGGTCGNLYKGVPKNSLTKKNVIVIRAGSMSQSQCSQKVDGISDYIKSKGRRLIPDLEIGLAILNCSTTKYCNPDYNVVNSFAPETNDVVPNSNIIAKHTPYLKTDDLKLDEIIELPESVVFESTEVQHNINLNDQKIDSDETDCTEKFAGFENQLQVTESDEVDFTVARKRKQSDYPAEQNVNKKANIDNIAFKENPSSANSLSQDMFVEPSSQHTVHVSNIAKKQPIPSTSAAKKKSWAVNLSMFMDTSQIIRSENSEPTPENIDKQESKKRARVAAICSDDDDDDLFAFASSATKKKKKENKQMSDSQLGQQSTQTRNKTKSSNAASNNIQAQNGGNMLKPKFQLPPKRSIKIPTEGWLSKSMSRIKVETNDGTDYPIKEEPTSTDWVKSLKGGFEVRVRPMSFAPRSFREIPADVVDSQTTVASNGKNFKAFVKKRNYKPQSTIISTVPVYVGLKTNCGL